jgi:transcriptional regulator with XRE-family HTH domain
MPDELAVRLAKNIKHLRDVRGFTQQQMAKLAELPRATWANLESGAANPTLSVMHRVATALQVSLEELLSAPRSETKFYPRATLTTRTQGQATVRKLLPDKIPAMEIDRFELPAGGRMTGVPHTPGTREYLVCEAGTIVLAVAGERWRLDVGDLVVFRGDQRHSYMNDSAGTAVGYSVVMLAPIA